MSCASRHERIECGLTGAVAAASTRAFGPADARGLVSKPSLGDGLEAGRSAGGASGEARGEGSQRGSRVLLQAERALLSEPKQGRSRIIKMMMSEASHLARLGVGPSRPRGEAWDHLLREWQGGDTSENMRDGRCPGPDRPPQSLRAP